jgi:hypothetical protein
MVRISTTMTVKLAIAALIHSAPRTGWWALSGNAPATPPTSGSMPPAPVLSVMK